MIADNKASLREDSLKIVPGANARAASIWQEPVDFWKAPAVIALNNFVHKSLSNWAFNVSVGCCHGCLFCYVPNVSTIKQGPFLAKHRLRDPDLEWGSYVLVRPWNEKGFLASLHGASAGTVRPPAICCPPLA
jgi:hypothetical protein